MGKCVLYIEAETKWRPFCRLQFHVHFREWKSTYIGSISLKFVPKHSIDNKSELILEMACPSTGDKPLPEPMLTLFTYAYMRHLALMC